MNDKDDFEFERYTYRYKIWYNHDVVNMKSMLYMPIDEFEEKFQKGSTYSDRGLRTLEPEKILKKLQNRKGWLTGIYETDEWICTPKHNQYGIPCLEFKMKEPVLYFNPKNRDYRLPVLEEDDYLKILYGGECYQVSTTNCTTLIYIRDIQYKPIK